LAAHKRPDLHTLVRDRIETAKIAKRLEEFVNGKVELSPHQVTAALGLLKKTLPDLQGVTVQGDPAKPIEHKHTIEFL
jgi:hypothetical protein